MKGLVDRSLHKRRTRPGLLLVVLVALPFIAPLSPFTSKVEAAVQAPAAYAAVQQGVIIPPGSDAQATCSFPAPYKGAMSFRSRYEGSGKSRDKINNAAERDYMEKTANVSTLQKYLAKKTDRIIKGKGTRDDLDCIISCLLQWVRESSLLSATENHTAKAVRKWTLAAVSANFLKISDIAARHARRSDLDEIHGWISALADTVVADYSGSPLTKINNHHYWAAWAVMTSAALLDRDDLYTWSKKMFETAMGQIDGNGYLPNELRRMSRAGLYHNFALSPLMGVAIFIDANGSDPFEMSNHALSRLVFQVLGGVETTDNYRAATGVRQADANMTINGRLAWLAMYETIAHLGPSELSDRCFSLASQDIALKSSRLGGDLRFLFMQ